MDGSSNRDFFREDLNSGEQLAMKGFEDNVNHPKHYKAPNGVETIDVIEGFTDPIAWNSGNVIKYICRWKNKNGLEDLKKAQFYLNRLIGIVERINNNEEDDLK